MIAKTMLRALARQAVRPYRPKRTPTKMVAVVVHLSSRSELQPDEHISLRHLHHYLGGYDKFSLAPRGSTLNLPGIQKIEFSPKFFGSALAFNRLMYSPKLYQLFEDYKYVLMYQLDCLVLSDDLLSWCERDFDYIGAPWMPFADKPWVDEPRVGNGGFALMKVEAALQVLYNRFCQEPLSFWKDSLSRGFTKYAKPPPEAPPKSASLFRKAWYRVQRSEINWLNNDMFWGFHAARYYPEFRIPDWRVALQFAFEEAPSKCFEINNGRLPFGCHAWAKFDRKFWEPHLLTGASQPLAVPVLAG